MVRARQAVTDSAQVGIRAHHLSTFDSLRASGSTDDFTNLPSLQLSGESPASTFPISFGFRWYASFYSASLDYVKTQLGRFQLENNGVEWGVNLTSYLTGWGYYLEGEFGFNFGSNRKLFEGATHNVVVQSAMFGLTLRRGIHNVLKASSSHAPRIDVLPGISAGYVADANVIMQEEGREDWEQVLLAEGWVWSVGVAVRWSLVFLEYRYRWWKLTDAEPDGGGGFFFTGEPEIDFSGHFLGLGVDMGPHLWSRR